MRHPIRLVPLVPLALPLLAAPAAAQAKPGDVLVKRVPNANEVCIYRPDGTQVACSQGTPTDWWIGATLAPDLGWVTLALGTNGWSLLRFDALGAHVWTAALPQVANVEELDTTSDGRLAVGDPNADAVHFYDFFGNHQASWTFPGPFTPNRICAGPDGDLWAFDHFGQEARHYDSAGNLLSSFPLTFAPWEVELAADGTLWMTEGLASKIVRHLDPTGAVLATWSYAHGTPEGLAEAEDGSLWVTTAEGKLQRVDSAGNLLASFPVGAGAIFVQVVAPGGPLGQSFCGPAVPNSTGSPGAIAASGRPYVLLDELSLEATDLPPDRFGIFLAGLTQGLSQPAGSQGNLCLAAPFALYQADVASTGPLGRMELALDLTAIPTNPPAPVMPGETWSFQAWFRDRNPGSTTNFTDGVAVTFQ